MVKYNFLVKKKKREERREVEEWESGLYMYDISVKKEGTFYTPIILSYTKKLCILAKKQTPTILYYKG